MQKQQQNRGSESKLISVSKIEKFSKLMGLTPISYQMIQLLQITQSKSKTMYGVYTSESIIKLLNTIQDNSQEFLQIFAINTTLSKNIKKDFVVNKILREHSLFSFQDLLFELHFIAQQSKNNQIYNQFILFIKHFFIKVKYLLLKYFETLMILLPQCLNFYIRRKTITQNSYKYSVVIGLDKISISCVSSNLYCENIMNGLLAKLREHCLLDNFQIDDKEFSFQSLQTTGSNILQTYDICDQFIECYERKERTLQEMIIQDNRNSQIFCTQLVMNTLTKYAEDIFILIEGAIVFLTNLVLQKKQIKSLNYNRELISMINPLNMSQSITETYINLYCEHFEGIPRELYHNGLDCPHCSQTIILDQSQSTQSIERNKNIFQNLLVRNYLNPRGNNVVYYFRDKIFELGTKYKFTSYPHFSQFIKVQYFVRDRPDVVMLMEHEKISLYSKIWGKKKLFSQYELVETPVRGKYCRHLEFFQLVRVYQKFVARKQGQSSFECFLCFQPIEYEQLIYLHQMKLLIDLAKLNFYDYTDRLLNCYIQINHNKRSIELCCELEKGYMKKSHELPIYKTLIDPLTKSQNSIQKNENQQQIELQLTQEFCNFFFGH